MIDVGNELEASRESFIERLRQTPPADWSLSDLENLKTAMSNSSAGLPLKHAYGSNFAYRDVEKLVPLSLKGVAHCASLSKGGLSNVWGANVLPYIEEDLEAWPVSLSDLRPHYDAVAGLMGYAARSDGLERLYPLYGVPDAELALSSQARSILRDLDRNREALASAGFQYGQSRLAVRSTANKSAACIHCGLCLYGCPYGSIYSSTQTLSGLQAQSNFQYVSGYFVTKLRESRGQVRVEAIRHSDNAARSFEARAVFVGGGLASSTKLLLSSLDAYDRELEVRDSQYFLLPVLLPAENAAPLDERFHTLAQLFLAMRDPAFGSRTVHLQLYTYNEVYLDTIERKLGILKKPLKRFAGRLASRLALIQGYLHSEDSATIGLKLSARAGTIEMRARRTRRAIANVKKVARKIYKSRKMLGALPLLPLLQIPPPGRGCHSGGSFPMRRDPKEFECDTSGRPTGFNHVYLIDSSVFPSVPATTITYSVMANAHRIGSRFAESRRQT